MMDAIRVSPQGGSPLFSKLPAEIRAEIFALALRAADDTSKPYRPDRVFYRPGYHHHKKTNCALLRTCKRIYGETRLLPVSVNEHIFWLFNGPWLSIGRVNRHTSRWNDLVLGLNEDQKSAIQLVHIFAQQCNLESLPNIFGWRAFTFRTSCLHITIRHSDWWSWESPPASSDRLGICPWRENRTSCQQMLAEPAQPTLEYIKPRIERLTTWGGQVCQIEGLKVLKMEFETDKAKKSQLKVVTERAKGWKFPLTREETALIWTGKLEESSWEGLKKLKDDYQVLKEKPIADDLPKRKYYVVTMTWEAVPTSRLAS